jgi:hypothetical protein
METFVYVRQNTMGRVVKKINKRLRDLPHLTRTGMRKWGNKLAMNMRVEAKMAPRRGGGGLPGIQSQDGRLFRGMRWDQPQNSNYGQLLIPRVGVMLDSMRPHRLYFMRRAGPRLTWALRAQSESIREKARMVRRGTLNEFHIRVDAHPFIRKAFRKTRHNLRRDLKTYIVDRPTI